jgi:hypothetical protein
MNEHCVVMFDRFCKSKHKMYANVTVRTLGKVTANRDGYDIPICCR